MLAPDKRVGSALVKTLFTSSVEAPEAFPMFLMLDVLSKAVKIDDASIIAPVNAIFQITI